MFVHSDLSESQAQRVKDTATMINQKIGTDNVMVLITDKDDKIIGFLKNKPNENKQTFLEEINEKKGQLKKSDVLVKATPSPSLMEQIRSSKRAPLDVEEFERQINKKSKKRVPKTEEERLLLNALDKYRAASFGQDDNDEEDYKDKDVKDDEWND
jgi:hypothetical protein